MDIVFINKNKIKVILYEEDIDMLGITTSLIDCDDDVIKNTLDYVLDKISEDTGVDTKDSKIFVEVYRNIDDTISIYFTRLDRDVFYEPEPKKRYKIKQGLFSPFVAEFKDINEMIKCCVALYKNYCHRIRKSSVYKLDNKFYIILMPLDNNDVNITGLLEEFMCRPFRGEILSAYINEHGMPIIKKDAVDTINTYFNK